MHQVDRGGIEPPTPGFSQTLPKIIFKNSQNRSFQREFLGYPSLVATKTTGGDKMATKEKSVQLFLTVKEICEALRISRWAVYRLIENGQLDAKRFGRSIRVSRESFDRYVANA